MLRARADARPPIWSYDGAVPGPTLRLKRGEELRVRLVNELPEPTTIHWHGVRLPNSMDGVPHLTQPPVAPGASFDYRFRGARRRHVLLLRRPAKSTAAFMAR